MSDAAESPKSRLARLSGFLAADSDNLTLLADAAQTAFDAGDLEGANDLLDRYAALVPLPPAQSNLLAVVKISQGRFAEARSILLPLAESAGGDPGARFNLAFAQAMLGDFAGADSNLDQAALLVSPRAPSLKVQALHALDRLDEALACGEELRERHPKDAALAGALASVALDAGDIDRARALGLAAETHEDGLAVLGMLELAAERPEAALVLHDRALAINPLSARALVGRGLALLAVGQAAAGAASIDEGAALFERHLGSWLAAGWAHFSLGDRSAARSRFQRALDLDDRFAEAQGAVAVLDILDGRNSEGERRVEVALRLDRRCLSAALAKSLLAARSGDPATAERIRQIALNTPIGASGKTIAQALPGLTARSAASRAP